MNCIRIYCNSAYELKITGMKNERTELGNMIKLSFQVCLPLAPTLRFGKWCLSKVYDESKCMVILQRRFRTEFITEPSKRIFVYKLYVGHTKSNEQQFFL
jgi:hypothetical protein